MYLFNHFFKNVGTYKSILSIGNKNKIIYTHYSSSNLLNTNTIAQHTYKLIFILLRLFIKNQLIFYTMIYNKELLFHNNYYYLKNEYYFLLNHFNYIYTYSKRNFFFFFFFNTSHINNSYFFYKWFFIETYKKYKLNYIVLPKKKKKYTLLRSPFVFKKGREQFIQYKYKWILEYSHLLTNNFFNVMMKNQVKKTIVKHKFSIE